MSDQDGRRRPENEPEKSDARARVSVPESPDRRRLFTLLAVGAGAAITGALGSVLGILALAPLR